MVSLDSSDCGKPAIHGVCRPRSGSPDRKLGRFAPSLAQALALIAGHPCLAGNRGFAGNPCHAESYWLVGDPCLAGNPLPASIAGRPLLRTLISRSRGRPLGILAPLGNTPLFPMPRPTPSCLAVVLHTCFEPPAQTIPGAAAVHGFAAQMTASTSTYRVVILPWKTSQTTCISLRVVQFTFAVSSSANGRRRSVRENKQSEMQLQPSDLL